MVMSVKGQSNTAQTTCERKTSQTSPMAREPCDSYISYGEGALTSGLGAPALQPTHTVERHRASRQSGPRRPLQRRQAFLGAAEPGAFPRRMSAKEEPHRAPVLSLALTLLSWANTSHEEEMGEVSRGAFSPRLWLSGTYYINCRGRGWAKISGKDNQGKQDILEQGIDLGPKLSRFIAGCDLVLSQSFCLRSTNAKQRP